jgi:uncharacterized membrane protein (DUF485 family)
MRCDSPWSAIVAATTLAADARRQLALVWCQCAVSQRAEDSLPARRRIGASPVAETPMETDLARRIDALPKYRELRSRRSRFGWWLTAAMMVVYYGFILLVAFDKELLAQRLGAGVMTLGIPIGLGVIVFTIVITTIYVKRANSEYDELTDAVAKAVLR